MEDAGIDVYNGKCFVFDYFYWTLELCEPISSLSRVCPHLK